MIIEETIIKYLIGLGVADGNVSAERPQEVPTEYVLVEKTGSGRTDRYNQAMIAIQSISSTSLYNAAEINEIIKDAILKMPETVTNIFGVQLNSDYNFTNTNTKEHRYQAVFNFYYA